MVDPQRWDCYLVRRDEAGDAHGRIETIGTDDLPAGEVLIRVSWSSLNYKDAMAARAHPGVARRFPHVPGIDAVGKVVTSTSPDFSPGQDVLVTGYELGAGQWGGWCQAIRVPAEWVVPLPAGLSPREAMVLGTAGFTAAQCVMRLQQNGISPDSGPIVVTGATGGVGSLAIGLLSHLGYHVTASTGKSDQADWLRDRGAETVIGRDELLTSNERAMTATCWAGAVDTVGGDTLASILRATQLNGCVTACGMVAGIGLPLTVFPFILRGVTLAGVTSQSCPMALRREIWERLATRWRLSDLAAIARQVDLADLEEPIEQILAGNIRGRVLVRLPGDGVQ